MNELKARREYTRGVPDIQPLFCPFFETVSLYLQYGGYGQEGGKLKIAKGRVICYLGRNCDVGCNLFVI